MAGDLAALLVHVITLQMQPIDSMIGKTDETRATLDCWPSNFLERKRERSSLELLSQVIKTP